MTTQPSFYVTGGNLRRDAPSYVERQADADLYTYLRQGEFCYLLDSRQLGKSSLMVRTAARLREEGIAIISLSLQGTGQNLTADQWYLGLLLAMGEQLVFEEELDQFWQAHQRLGALPRWLAALRQMVLTHCPGPVVILIDEIDYVRALPFSMDEFFAGIRECYHRRSEEPEFRRLTFCLIGTAAPSDLIRDPLITPFNIGRRIELTDFSDQEAAPLAAGLGEKKRERQRLLQRVLYWTGGHPFLTQRLCQAVAEAGNISTAAGVDQICERLLLVRGAIEKEDNLANTSRRLLNRAQDWEGVLELYRQVLTGGEVPHDETDPLVSVLRLSGVTRPVDGYLRVRNRIYERVFDQKWIAANMKEAELGRPDGFQGRLVRAASEEEQRSAQRTLSPNQGLPTAFPHLKTPASRHSPLPLQRRPLLGRETAVSAVRDLLCQKTSGLITLTGPGGIGKTRLAVQVATELAGAFGDGAAFVDLQPIRDSGLVVSAIAQALGVQPGDGRPLGESLEDYLREKQLLLVLDNCEQILAAAPQVGELLGAAPGLKVLATSRAPLRLQEEQEYAVPPLALPDLRQLPPVEALARYAAVHLFIQRATAVQPGFQVTDENAPAVAEICHRLEGLPLAIELAAARVKHLSPRALLARLERRLELLTGGERDRPSRHQTLRATITWSYDLLREPEQQLFRRLSVFVGGWTLEAAEAVCGDCRARVAGGGTSPGQDRDASLHLPVRDGAVLDGIASLVDHSLVQREQYEGAEPRFRMPEMIREYAWECLAASGGAPAIRRCHAGYFLEFAELAAPQLWGPRQAAWLDRLEAEHANFRAVLDWAVEAGSSPSMQVEAEIGMRVATALSLFWDVRGDPSELWTRLSVLLGLPGAAARTSARARAMLASVGLANELADRAMMIAVCQEAQAIARERGDRGCIARSLWQLGSWEAEYPAACGFLEQCLALSRESGDQVMVYQSLTWLGERALNQGEYETARAHFVDALGMAHACGNHRGIAVCLSNLADIAVREGRYDAARPLLEESLAIREQIGYKRGIRASLGRLGNVYLFQGDYETARSCYEQALTIARELGGKLRIADCLNSAARAAHDQGDLTAAHAFLEEALAFWCELECRDAYLLECLECLAWVILAMGEPERATRLLGATAKFGFRTTSPSASPEDQAQYERILEATRSAMGEAFPAAWNAGAQMTWEQVIGAAFEALALTAMGAS